MTGRERRGFVRWHRMAIFDVQGIAHLAFPSGAPST
jgi:hypothetical protein